METDKITKDKFKEQESQYNFPYHFLVENNEDKIIKPFKVYYWLYDYMRLINYLKLKVNEKNYKNILDFGCGEGRFLFELKKKKLDKKFFGFEISKSAKLFFRAFNPEIKLFDKTEDILKYKNYFDVITFSEVIEHIPDENVKENISLITSLLKKGGYLFVTAPHKNLPIQKKHYRHYDSNDLMTNFDQSKFELVNKEFLFKSSFTKKILNKIFFNRLFLINFDFMYKIFFHINKNNFSGNENNCETIFLTLKKINE